MKEMIKVYVAGPYSDDNVLGVLKNIGRGQEYAAYLFILGFAPFTPWHDKEFVIHNWDTNFEVDYFYNYSNAWLTVSDVVFVVPNSNGLRNWEDSFGTVVEIQRAKELKIPVFYSVDELLRYRENLQNKI